MRYFHVSKLINKDGSVSRRGGRTHKVGRNAAKRANRQGDIRARVKARNER